MNTPTLETVAARFGCSVEQVRAQYAKNASQLAEMATAAAARRDGKLRGYSAAELRGHAARYRRQAAGGKDQTTA